MSLFRFYFFISLGALCLPGYSQSFQRAYGTALNMQGFCVQQTSDGGFIICGNIVLDSTNTDLCLLKTNSVGDTLWTKHYGGPAGEYEGIVQQTADGGFVMTGTTHSFGAGMGDILMIKTDGNGDTLWARTFGGAGDEIGQSIRQTFDGGFIIGGHTDTYGIKGDLYLIRTNSLGDTLWTRNYGGAQHDHGFCVVQTSDSGFVLAGHSVSFGPNGGFYAVRTDLNGDTLWSRGYGGISDSYCYSIAQTSDGGFILAGATTAFGAGGTDAMAVKITSQGDTAWTRTYGNAGDEYFNCVRPTPDGGAVFAGTVSPGINSSDAYVVRTDSHGDTLWTRTFGGWKDDEGTFVDVCSDSGFVVGGLTKSTASGRSEIYLIRMDRYGNAGCTGASSTTFVSRPDSVMYQVATRVGAPATRVGGAALTTGRAAHHVTNACSTFGIQNFSADEFSLQLYPCPMTDLLEIRSEKEIGAIRIYDGSGRVYYEGKSAALETQIRTEGFPPGLYLVEVAGRHFRIVKQ